MLKADKLNYYAFNMRDGFFVPQVVNDKKLIDKLKQIVVPELKLYFKKLQDNQDKIPIECKLSGVPIYQDDTAEKLIERLVAVQEFKVRKLLKEKLR